MNNIDISEGLRALAAITPQFPGAVLAGGYLRDKLNGRSPKDIDIFIPHQPGLGHIVKGDIAGALKVDLFCTGAEYMSGGEVGGVWDVVIDGINLPVQVIELGPGVDVQTRMASLDFDFCQVWHDGFNYHFTDAFADGFETNRVTLCRCEDQKQFDRSMRRWERLKAKYPDFVLVIPARFEAFKVPADGIDL